MIPLIINSTPSPKKHAPVSQPKYLAIPQHGTRYKFEEITHLILISLCVDLTIKIVSFTEENLAQWQIWLNSFSPNANLLELFDANQATLEDCVEFLSRYPGDVVVFHGACSELWANQVSVGYLATLIEAVPAGVVMIV